MSEYVYLGELCPHCRGDGYIRRCPNCNSRDVEVIVVPAMWWEWQCQQCGWKYRHRFEEKEDKHALQLFSF